VADEPDAPPAPRGGDGTLTAAAHASAGVVRTGSNSPPPQNPASVAQVPGVYAGFIDKFPMGSVMHRSLTIQSGQCHVQRYLRPLLDRIQNGEIDPSFVITHRLRLDEVSDGYETFKHKEDECMKVVMRP